MRKSPIKQDKEIGENKEIKRFTVGKLNLWKIRITEWEKLGEGTYLGIIEQKKLEFLYQNGSQNAHHSKCKKEPHPSTSGEISDTRNKGALIAFRCGAYKRWGISSIAK